MYYKLKRKIFIQSNINEQEILEFLAINQPVGLHHIRVLYEQKGIYVFKTLNYILKYKIKHKLKNIDSSYIGYNSIKQLHKK